MNYYLCYLKAVDADCEKGDRTVNPEKWRGAGSRRKTPREWEKRRRRRRKSTIREEAEVEEELRRNRRHDGVAAMMATSSRLSRNLE